VITQSTFDLAVTFSGQLFGQQVTQDDTVNGTVGVLITDCMNNPVACTPTLTNENNQAITTNMVDASALQAGLFLFLLTFAVNAAARAVVARSQVS